MPDFLIQSVEPLSRNERPQRADRALSRIVAGMTELVDSSEDAQNAPTRDLVALLKAVEVKDRTAFEALYDVTVSRVFSLAMRITRQQALAEEVVSDVYFQVWRQAAAYSPGRGGVIAWLCVLCRSRALDALRRDNTALRQAEVGLDKVPEQLDSRDPSDLLQAVEQGSAVHAALRKLSEQQRQLVGLAYFKGYTHSELAAITRLPLGTVKTHLHRAMARLKELMSEEPATGGGSDE